MKKIVPRRVYNKEIKQVISDVNNFVEPYRTILLRKLIKHEKSNF